jgi:DNA-binding response OmpR family regulator
MSTALLIEEPEPGFRGYLARHLSLDGFEIVDEPSAAPPALVLVGDPRAVDRWSPEVPVIVIGRGGEDTVDRVRAFQRGCDDWVERPFAYDELLARIRAVLRRTLPPTPEVLDAGPVRIDRRTRSVGVAGVRVQLAQKEYDLLVALAVEPYRVWTKAELLRDVWDYRSQGRTRTLDAHASRLRLKLARHAPADVALVINVWGVGYRLLDPPLL